MEEQKKKNLWTWIKENPWTAATEVTLFTLSIVEMGMMLKANDRIGKLEKENQSLKGENSDLRGQIHATEKENRRLSHELNNAWYQNGKERASNEQK